MNPAERPQLPAVAFRDALPGARLMPVRHITSTMKPTLTFYDFVLVVPVDRFRNDGLYVFEEGARPVIRRVQWMSGQYPNRQVRVSYDQKDFGECFFPEDQINHNLIGQVAGILKMNEPDLIPGLLEAWP